MGFADVWNRTLVYFGIAEEDDWDEETYVTDEDLQRSKCGVIGSVDDRAAGAVPPTAVEPGSFATERGGGPPRLVDSPDTDHHVKIP